MTSARTAAALAALLLVGLSGCARAPQLVVLSDPLSAAEHLDLGVAYERRGELDLALAEYRKALRKDARLVRARVNIGNVLLARGEHDAARREYLRALDDDPSDAAATNNLAWAAIRSGRGTADALLRLEALLADPSRRTAPLLDTLGALRASRGDLEAALAAFDEAEAACDRDTAGGAADCTEDERREIAAHRADAAAGKRRPARPPGLVE